MARPRGKAGRIGRRRAAAFNAIGLGLALIVLPYLVGNTILAAGLRPFSLFGWLLLATGIALVFLFRQRSTAQPGHTDQQVAPPVRQARRPATPSPPVKRIDPVVVPTPAPASNSAPPNMPSTWGPGLFNVIEWRRFEAVVEALFSQAGFITKAQSHGPDEGVDVWLYSKSQPDGEPVSVVQCKHWKGKRVGVDKVRELRGVMASRNIARGQFATTSTFSADAMAFAKANGIKLHDLDGLLALIATRSPEQQQALLDVALQGDFWRPTCVNCGVKMVDRTPRQGGKAFWGCINYPRCRTTMQK